MTEHSDKVQFMTEELEIPDELCATYKRVMRRVPNELRGDTEFLRKIMVYLKIGGEKLARQRIEITKKPFREGYSLINRLIPEESLQEMANETSEEGRDGSPDEGFETASDDTLNNEDDES
jgi:hypothetical protein